ncbi:MAG: ATP synthase F1 subunit gamma [Planctomycetota bacterium]
MAKARAIVKRRRAVRNIRKITQTMQLIATARFQKTLQRATASQPYTRGITGMIATLGGQQAVDHPLLKPNGNHERSLVLVITSNRGLAGAYNASVLRRMLEFRRELEAGGLTPAMEVVGKKGLNFLRFLRVPVALAITDVEDKIAFARVAEMAERYMDLFRRKAIARVDVVYMQFHSVAVQRPVAAQLLPMTGESTDAPAGAAARAAGRAASPPRRPGARESWFEFSPAPDVLLAHLIPEAVKIRLYQFFNEAIVSEQVARMTAMKAATDAAGDMLKYLTRQYNRARQTQITTELADIVGGANAVQ